MMACATWIGTAAAAQVLASRNDDARTGANLSETKLTAANVNAKQFGRLFAYGVEGNIYAQPLVATNVQTAGGPRNIVYVATSDNLIYAFNADSNSSSGGLIWSRRLGDPPSHTGASGPVTVPFNGMLIRAPPSTAPRVGPIPWNDPTHNRVGTTTFMGNVGIIGTPVIDRSRNAIYLTARTKVGPDYVQTLHALDLGTGKERPGAPVAIARNASATSFAATENQRAGLALANGRVIVAWGSPGGEEEISRYNGYVLAFDSDNLTQVGCFTTGVQHAGGAGFWQAGRAPVVDDHGSVYFFSGNGGQRGQDPIDLCSANGSFPSSSPLGGQLTNALLQLDFGRAQPLVDQVIDPEQALLDFCDIDLGGSGPLLVPGGATLVGGGKRGLLHVFKLGPRGQHVLTQSVQVYDGPREVFQRVPDGRGGERCHGPGDADGQGGHHIMGGPVYWDSAAHGSLLYVSPESEYIHAYRFDKQLGQIDPTPHMRSPWQVLHHPGAILSLSANGNQHGTGILWAAQSDRTINSPQSPFSDQTKGIVRAFDADDLSRELWNSDQDGAPQFNFAKFTPITVANGKAYVPTFSGQLIVYGLR